jgi:hypothetical protein
MKTIRDSLSGYVAARRALGTQLREPAVTLGRFVTRQPWKHSGQVRICTRKMEAGYGRGIRSVSLLFPAADPTGWRLSFQGAIKPHGAGEWNCDRIANWRGDPCLGVQIVRARGRRARARGGIWPQCIGGGEG